MKINYRKICKLLTIILFNPKIKTQIDIINFFRKITNRINKIKYKNIKCIITKFMKIH